MNHVMTDRSNAATTRYENFLNMLRGQADVVFRRGVADEGLRSQAISVARGAARSFLATEQQIITDNTAEIAGFAHTDAMSALGATDRGIDETMQEFVSQSAYYTSSVISAQIERDVITMAQHNQTLALRVDLYVRAGRHTPSSAAAQVMIEDNMMPAFRFMDRMGRKFKASKHVRDINRLHLLHVYNEVYLAALVAHGHDTVFVDHPEPTYKWWRQELAIVPGGVDTDGLPSYYDVKDEIFHPSSQATLSLFDRAAL